jgi:hypothetical protein
MMLMDGNSLAPAMAIARIAYEDRFLLDARYVNNRLGQQSALGLSKKLLFSLVQQNTYP